MGSNEVFVTGNRRQNKKETVKGFPIYDNLSEKIVNELVLSGSYFDAIIEFDYDRSKLTDFFKKDIVYSEFHVDKYRSFVIQVEDPARYGEPFYISRNHGMTKVLGNSPEIVKKIRDFVQEKFKTKEDSQFKLFTVAERYIQTRASKLVWDPFSAEDINLLYGPEFSSWVDTTFLPGLDSTACSLTVFRGDTGNGKTSFLKHLIAAYSHKYSFYYVPVGVFEIFSNVNTIDRLMDIFEDEKQDGKKPVMIIEDAENLLTKRDSDGGVSSISTLLNLSDGIMGEALSAHYICTVNCEVSEIDSAFKRKGRLIGMKEFLPLTRERALSLAVAKGIKTDFISMNPEIKKFTLAEVFKSSLEVLVEGEKKTNPVGFGSKVT